MNSLTKKRASLQTSCLCSDSPGDWDHSCTVRVRDVFCRSRGENKRKKQYFLSLPFLKVVALQEEHDPASHGKTKQSQSNGHFLKLFILHVPLPLKSSISSCSFNVQDNRKASQQKALAEEFIAGGNQEALTQISTILCPLPPVTSSFQRHPLTSSPEERN